MKKAWSEAEKEILISKYPGGSRDQLMALLPGRTWVAICRMAHEMGIKSGRYLSQSQIDYMLENPEAGNAVFEKKFKKTKACIKSVRCRLGIGSAKDNSSDEISLTELGRMLGKKPKYFERTFMRNGLKIKQHKRYYLRMVKIKNALKFLEEHPKLWNATESEEWFFKACNKKFYETVFLPKLRAEHEAKVKARWGEWLDTERKRA